MRREPRSPRLRRRLAALGLPAVLGLACATFQHSAGTGAVAGRTLDVASPEGAARLAQEKKLDASIRGFVASNGTPEYLRVVDRQNLYLFYTQADQVVIFTREFLARSQVKRMPRIPGNLLKLLPKDAQQGVLARREEKKRRAAMRHPRPRAASPASPSPGWDDRRFNVNAVVARLRTPLTAADRGVGGWNEEKLPDGSLRRSTRFGDAVYDVRADRITLSAPIAAGAVRTPESARTGLVRVNNAVFGANARSVNQFVTGQADRVCADRSGRTQMARRVAGRTVRLTRVPASGVLVYMVTP